MPLVKKIEFPLTDWRFQTMDERFDKIEKNMATKEDLKNVEARLSQQIQGVRNSLDREIEERKDTLYDHEERIHTLEVETGLMAE